ncbi:flagellar hook-basal body complex protein FliE [Acidithiobacillus sp. MC6.1]|nr:flagellar hook-basal body complex protein FliE [Acidithiobacillus sp. MC6.1]
MTPSIQAVGASLAQSLLQLKTETLPSSTIIPAAGGGATSNHSGFAALITHGLSIVSQAQATAGANEKAFAAQVPGGPSLSQTMLSMQKSGIAFQELIGIRNELTRGYTTLISMPV